MSRPMVHVVLTCVVALVLTGCKQLAMDLAINPAKKEAAVRSEMKDIQHEIENYKVDHGQKPPATLDAVQSIVPPLFKNPFTEEKLTIVLGNITNVAQARQAPPGPLAPGVIEYSVFANGTDYAIRAGGGDGKALKQGEGTLILSDQ